MTRKMILHKYTDEYQFYSSVTMFSVIIWAGATRDKGHAN